MNFPQDPARIQAPLRERAYEAILSNTPDLAYVFDLQYRFIYANEVLLRMWGRSWDEAIGKTCLELGYEPWHAQMHAREIDQVVATRQSVRGQVPFNGAFGRRMYDYIFVPVVGADGEVEAVAGTTRDITDIWEADRRKDEFLAVLAHELRNPLAPVRTGVALLRQPRAAEASGRTLEMMERQLGHMARLIDDLMDVSRISTGKMNLSLQRMDARDAVKVAIEGSRQVIEAGRHELVMRLPAQPLWLDADRVRLEQVIGNLLNNAARYTPAGGRIEVLAREQDGELELQVRDNGMGVGPEALPRIFDMFVQEQRHHAQTQTGLGIGLALARQLVQMHAGNITAESAGPGQGSCFTISMPLADVRQAEVELLPREEDSPSTAALRILVVDDNVDAAETLAALLDLQGHATCVAHDGAQALDAAQGFQPDCALLDIGLPGMDGYELARRLRHEPGLERFILVALTGWGSSEDRLRAAQAGFDHHLTKPVETGRLEALLAGLARDRAFSRPETATAGH